MKNIAFFFLLICLTGCNTFELEETVSGQKGYSQWIGRQFKLKKDVLIVSFNEYGTENLELPYPSYPSIEEFRRTGKPKKHWWALGDRREVIGVADAGELFTIASIGFYTFSHMIGKTGVVIVKGPKDKKYYIRSPGLFYFSDGTLDPHENYVEMLSIKATDEPVINTRHKNKQ